MNATAFPINRQVVDAVFSFIESAVPSLKSVLELLRTLIDGSLPAASAYHAPLSAPLKLTEADLQAWVDEVFAFVESVVGGVWATATLKAVNAVIDQVGLPALSAWLVSLGILTA